MSYFRPLTNEVHVFTTSFSNFTNYITPRRKSYINVSVSSVAILRHSDIEEATPQGSQIVTEHDLNNIT